MSCQFRNPTSSILRRWDLVKLMEPTPIYLNQPVQHRSRALRDHFAKVPNSLARRHDLDPISKLLLIVLISHADTETQTTSWPSVPLLAKEVGCSDRAIQRASQKLQTMGLMTIEIRPGPNAKQNRTNVYIIENDAIAEGDTQSPGGEHQSPGGATGSPGVVSRSHPEEDPLEEYPRRIPKKKAAPFSDFLAAKRLEFPDIDVDAEWVKCQLWHEGRPQKKHPNWKYRLHNWLNKARSFQQDKKPQPPSASDDFDARYERWAAAQQEENNG